jgi:DNA-binding HxlR family transcriptional regulator
MRSGQLGSSRPRSLHPAGPRNGEEATRCAREVLDRIGDKWSLEVIHCLRDGSTRFMELKRAVAGISQRMLTVTLRGLERDGLVRRTVHAAVPPRVDYELTALGETLLEKVCGLVAWTDEHLDDIGRARREYDARRGG